MALKGRTISLTSSDGAAIDCYHVEAEGERRGGLVLIQEIFGVTDHIKELCDGFAADGYEVLSPALFDRTAPGFAVGYAPEDIARARALAENADWDLVTADVQMCVDQLKPRGPVFITGYCFGGSVVWVAACRVAGLSAASSYYGRLAINFIDETPQCPLIMHFGESDHTIPMENVEKIKAAHPNVPVHVYPAGHGFNSDRRADYHAESAALARRRTLDLFAAHG